ncbi:MAG: HesB/IscA family protein [Nodosilinea sp.]
MINLRPAALEELKRLLKNPSGPPYRLRLHLEAGGCADWTYCLSPVDPETSPCQDEARVSCGDMDILVATSMLPHMEGLTIDYAEDLMGGGFRFINPQAGYTCGCGNSFSTVASESRADCGDFPSASS